MLRRGLSSRVLPGSGRAAEFVRVAALAAAGVALAVLLWQLVPRLGLFVEFNQTVLRYPWTIDYDEGVNIGSAYLLSQGQNPYGPNHDGFVSTPYPPIHTALGALILRVGGISLAGSARSRAAIFRTAGGIAGSGPLPGARPDDRLG